MTTTIAFDVYGTLIDTHGVVVSLQRMIGDKALPFSKTWREKQLEYSFRRGLMQNYATFAVCTAQALDHTCALFNLVLTEEQKEQLLSIYRILPVFDDVAAGLVVARDAGFRLFAFSNGSADAIETLLANAGIRDLFLDVISVDEIKSFKPNPGVYCHFLRRAGAAGSRSWLVSSNPFDVIGALSAGMKAAWIKRTADAFFDPWGIEPTITVQGLTDLTGAISTYETA